MDLPYPTGFIEELSKRLGRNVSMGQTTVHKITSLIRPLFNFTAYDRPVIDDAGRVLGIYSVHASDGEIITIAYSNGVDIPAGLVYRKVDKVGTPGEFKKTGDGDAAVYILAGTTSEVKRGAALIFNAFRNAREDTQQFQNFPN